MALREHKIGQTTLIPNNALDRIPENHPCFLVEKIVNQVDFKETHEKFTDTA